MKPVVGAHSTLLWGTYNISGQVVPFVWGFWVLQTPSHLFKEHAGVLHWETPEVMVLGRASRVGSWAWAELRVRKPWLSPPGTRGLSAVSQPASPGWVALSPAGHVIRTTG